LRKTRGNENEKGEEGVIKTNYKNYYHHRNSYAQGKIFTLGEASPY
jgi:hypothetical protein